MSRPFRRPVSLRRVALAVALSAGLVVLGAGPAFADPAGPTNYESVVTSIEPIPAGVEFTVVGGDAFLAVTVAPGHEVLIPGYAGEPYVRIDGDGSVWVNENSPAHYINRDRYGQVPVPEGADEEGEAHWVKVADGGRYAWHDHRTHWMSTDPPPAVSGQVREVVFPWEIGVIIDGREAAVQGELYWIPSQTPLGPLLVGLIALLPLSAWRPGRMALLASLTLGTAMLAALVTVAANNGTPGTARGFPVLIVFPIAAAIAAAYVLARRNGASMSVYLTVLGGLLLAAWSLAGIEALWLPVLPSTLAPPLERAAIAFVLWAGIGVAVLSTATVFTRGAVRGAANATPPSP